MSDVTTASTGTILKIPCVKSKMDVELDTGKLTGDYGDAAYHAALVLGFKHMVNGGMTSMGAEKDYTVNGKHDPEAFRTECHKIALQRVDDLYAGKLKITGVKGVKTKASGEYDGKTVTEARRIARGMVKAGLKERKIRISSVSASDITEAANAMLNDEAIGPGLYAQAQKNLMEQGKVDVPGAYLDSIKPDPKKEKALDEANAAKKAQLSAKQAGMTTAH